MALDSFSCLIGFVISWKHSPFPFSTRFYISVWRIVRMFVCLSSRYLSVFSCADQLVIFYWPLVIRDWYIPSSKARHSDPKFRRRRWRRQHLGSVCGTSVFKHQLLCQTYIGFMKFGQKLLYDKNTIFRVKDLKIFSSCFSIFYYVYWYMDKLLCTVYFRKKSEVFLSLKSLSHLSGI